MMKRISDFLLLLFLGFTLYFIIFYVVGFFDKSLRPLKIVPEEHDAWLGVGMLVVAVVDFFIARKLFTTSK